MVFYMYVVGKIDEVGLFGMGEKCLVKYGLCIYGCFGYFVLFDDDIMVV